MRATVQTEVRRLNATVPSEHGRGWGPFTGRQLTVIVCVAVVSIVAIPTAALAASGVFTSSSNATPAVTGTNTAASGTGVKGTGKKYGVYSNGPLGVAAGKALRCTGCVGPDALAVAAKPGPKGFGYKSQSIVLGIGANDIPGAPAFVAPADASCLVTTTVEENGNGNGAAPASYYIADVRGAISVNGAPYFDDGLNGLGVVSNGGSYTQSPVTVTSVFAISAGQTIRFGANYYPYYSTFSQAVRIRQGYICS